MTREDTDQVEVVEQEWTDSDIDQMMDAMIQMSQGLKEKVRRSKEARKQTYLDEIRNQGPKTRLESKYDRLLEEMLERLMPHDRDQFLLKKLDIEKEEQERNFQSKLSVLQSELSPLLLKFFAKGEFFDLMKERRDLANGTSPVVLVLNLGGIQLTARADPEYRGPKSSTKKNPTWKLSNVSNPAVPQPE